MSTAPRLVDLRVGDINDLNSVVHIMNRAFDPHFGEAWSSAQCIGMLALQGVWLTLACEGEALVGFAMARAVAGDGELLLLAVEPERRGRGIGGTLLRSVIADARDRRTERLHLEMRAGNPALALYRAHGFTQVGQRRAYYRGLTGEAFDAHTYAMALAD
ncbi:GNAT family N-acetyltransferase [uncultured Sphingomonas sp.]|uniref:GNAT family N-acetyltransferase n=1 Tax=uncultured Sphingomonas sp. TaxID=158754 RepID=UPI0025E5B5F3|nr:GNAT family N-acetyltransferase [uncultured Sphingomonas sp.]